jgi:hypothetical protein
MEEQQSFWETTPSPHAPPVWSVLDPEQRAEVVSTLARLIEKIAIDASQTPANHQEMNHE